MGSQTVICTYRPKFGAEKQLEALLAKHWETLNRLGLVTDERAQIFRSIESRNGRTTYVEIFHWKDEAAVDEAHQLPEVQAMWEPMGTLVEPLDGLPAWEFPHYDRVKA